MQPPVSRSFAVAMFAAVLFLASVAGFGALLPTYSHSMHPVALLGATPVPRGGLFNVLGFAIPGLLAAWTFNGFRGHLDGLRWSARIGAQTLLLSAIAFALHAVLPLDLADVEAPGNRLQGAAWTLWWLATLVGGVLLALGLRRTPLAGIARSVLVLAAGVVVLSLVAPIVLPDGLAQRLAFAAWWLAVIVVSRGPGGTRRTGG